MEKDGVAADMNLNGAAGNLMVRRGIR